MIIFYSNPKKDHLEYLLYFLENGLKFQGGLLFSYLYFVENKNQFKLLLPLLIKIKKYNVPIMLDSGAHSFLYVYFLLTTSEAFTKTYGHEISETAYKILKENRIFEYNRNYIMFVRKYRKVFDYAVELDIQPIVGKNGLLILRKQWRDMKPIFVVHGEQIDEVISWINEYGLDYIGIGGTGVIETDRIYKIKYAKELKKRKPEIKIHAFAETGSFFLKRTKEYIYSTDSTSWTFLTRSRVVINPKNVSQINVSMRPYVLKVIVKKVVQYLHTQTSLPIPTVEKIINNILSNSATADLINMFSYEIFLSNLNKYQK